MLHSVLPAVVVRIKTNRWAEAQNVPTSSRLISRVKWVMGGWGVCDEWRDAYNQHYHPATHRHQHPRSPCTTQASLSDVKLHTQQLVSVMLHLELLYTHHLFCHVVPHGSLSRDSTSSCGRQ
jgi:hypothetical protein